MGATLATTAKIPDMITAHVNDEAISLQFDASGNLPHHDWETLLDELKSHHIPSLYQRGKRSHASVLTSGQTLVVIYFTPKTVTKLDAINILKRWDFIVLEPSKDEPPQR